MLYHVPAVLKPEQVAECRRLLDTAAWVDGRASAGFMAESVKKNQEVAFDDPKGRQVGELILGKLPPQDGPGHLAPRLFQISARGRPPVSFLASSSSSSVW